jgi:hypothetical protein
MRTDPGARAQEPGGGGQHGSPPPPAPAVNELSRLKAHRDARLRALRALRRDASSADHAASD